MVRPLPVPGPAAALDGSLGALLEVSGGRAVRVVDGRGRVVAARAAEGHAGRGGQVLRDTADDPAVVTRLVRDALVLGAGGDGDVLVTTVTAAHLLRASSVPGAFLHLRLDRGGDIARARRALAAPALHGAVHAALTGALASTTPLRRVPPADGAGPHPTASPGSRAPDGPTRPRPARSTTGDRAPGARAPGMPAGGQSAPGMAGPPPVSGPPAPEPSIPEPSIPGPSIPGPRTAADGAAGRPEQRGRVPRDAAPTASRTPAPVPLAATSAGRGGPAEQPALAVLVALRPRTGDGVLAAQALAQLAAPGVARPLPRRHPARPVAAPPVPPARPAPPEQAWACDDATLRRLLAGLRRLP